MNKTILIGRLTKDPSLSFLSGSGTAVATFTMAVDRKFKKDGEQQADFIPVVVWGKQAETVANYSGKGKLIGIAGRIQTRNYDNKEGKKVYVTEVIAEDVQIIEWANSNSENVNNSKIPSSPFDSSDFGADITPVDTDGEIPF